MPISGLPWHPSATLYVPDRCFRHDSDGLGVGSNASNSAAVVACGIVVVVVVVVAVVVVYVFMAFFSVLVSLLQLL